MQGSLLIEKSEAALKGGCKLLQYRNKTASFEQKIQEATQLKLLCERYQTLLIINDSIELARNVKADGVHLGQTDTPVKKARNELKKYFDEDFIIGVTCHDSLQLAEQAEKNGASYVAFGRFFPSKTKPEAPPATLQLIEESREKIRLPVVAIGGINSDNASLLIQAGVDSIAVSDDLFSKNILSTVPDSPDTTSTMKNKTIEEQAKFYQSLFT